MDRCCGFADVFLRPISGHDSVAEATHHATSFWIGTDSGRLYSCCIVRLGFCVRFPYNTCGGAHEATFSFEPRLGHGCGSCSAGGGALFTEVPLAPDERLGAANHAQIPCCPTKGPTDCYRKNANRAHRDPRFHFKDRHTVSFFISTMASMEPQFHRRNKLNTHTSCACIWLVAARDRHNNTRSISVVPQELIEKGVETKTKSKRKHRHSRFKQKRPKTNTVFKRCDVVAVVDTTRPRDTRYIYKHILYHC